MTDQRFRPKEHLRRPADFQRVYEARRSGGAGALVAFALPNGLAWNRLGLSVGKRVGNAVMRNRVKRRLREAFRQSKAALPGGYDFVIVAKSAAIAEVAELLIELPKLLSRAIQRCADLSPPS